MTQLYAVYEILSDSDCCRVTAPATLASARRTLRRYRRRNYKATYVLHGASK